MILLALIGALALASIPLTVGWRRTANEASLARALGLSPPKVSFDPEKFARQTGTGLSFNQIVFGCMAWLAGGFVAGWFLGTLAAFLFAMGCGFLYAGSLYGRRQDVRLRQAKDILRGLGVVETLLAQGRPLNEALSEAAQAVGPDGRMVLSDLVYRMRAAPAEQAAQAVREWTLGWANPAVDVVATALLAAIEGRIEIAPLVKALRKTLTSVIEVLSRARAVARGIEWQIKFLTLFPPGVLVLMAVVTPETGDIYAAAPWLVLPALLGAATSYVLSTRMIQNGLSIETSLGLQGGEEVEIEFDRMGRVL